MLILSLPLIGLSSKSTSLSAGFCVCRPWQYDKIFWELNIISGFFAFFRLIVWADGINKCAWYLPGGRGCWLKGPHQMPSVSWMFHHSLHFHIYCVISIKNFVSIVLLLWMIGEWNRWWWWWWGGEGGVGGRVVDSYQVLGGGIGGGYFLTVFCFLLLLLSSVLMSCLFFQWVEHDRSCVCFFIICLLCLWSL